MTATIAAGLTLTHTPWCVLRQQVAEYLVYNSRTDELHLIGPLGHYLYLLCDGLRTVAELQDLVPGTDVAGFLDDLVARGILEPVGAP
ncbi:hypothetical protein Asp14428_75490 [Actinoplanes sp. NBRC 14428]|nr:hypothetical protein Asp14428_75490 [Actinoplanes sp. NBRC 14428]